MLKVAEEPHRGRRGRRRDLRDDQRQSRPGRGEDSGLSRPWRVNQPALRCGPANDLPQGTDSHDYKYGAAIWEECLAVAEPRWHAPLAAAAMFNLPGAKTQDSPLMIRAREAVGKVMG